jgi:hypothetical protein
MLIRETNCSSELILNNLPITFVSERCDLEVTVDSKLRFTSHINNKIAIADVSASLILKCFVSRDVETLLRAFKTCVQPLLEYASCVRSRTYDNAVQQIESGQRKFTKRLPGFAHTDYGGRLAALNLDSLELRRLHLDFIHAYKILFWLLSVRANDYFFFSEQFLQHVRSSVQTLNQSLPCSFSSPLFCVE